jgi:hypothetical protein
MVEISGFMLNSRPTTEIENEFSKLTVWGQLPEEHMQLIDRNNRDR